MSGLYPELMNDDFLVLAFQTHFPAPTSADHARCMQSACTIVRGARSSDRVSSVPISIIVYELMGVVSLRAMDFQHYIMAFRERRGWRVLDTIVGDQKKCGALY